MEPDTGDTPYPPTMGVPPAKGLRPLRQAQGRLSALPVWYTSGTRKGVLRQGRGEEGVGGRLANEGTWEGPLTSILSPGGGEEGVRGSGGPLRIGWGVQRGNAPLPGARGCPP